MNHRADLLLIILALAVVLFIALNQPARAATPMTNRSPLVFHPVEVPQLLDRLATAEPTRSAVLPIHAGRLTPVLSALRERDANPSRRDSLGRRPRSPRRPASSGTATWYAGDYSSGERTLYAAVGSWHWGDTPYRVRVTSGGRSVTVTVRDYCGACHVGRHLIDLSPTAFERLAPLSRGVIRVTVGGEPHA